MAELYSEEGRLIRSRGEIIHISGSGSYSFETAGHGVVRQTLKVNSVSGTLTVTSKDGQAAGSCSHSLTNDFSAASSAGSQRKVNACDEFVDYAFSLAAPVSRVGSVSAASGNTSTGSVGKSGSLDTSDLNAYDVEASVKSAGVVGSGRVGSAVAADGNTTVSTVTVSGSLDADDVAAHSIVLKVHTAGDTSETSVPIDVTIDGEAQEQATLSSDSLSISLSSLGLTVSFTTAAFVKDDSWTIAVSPCPVVSVDINGEASDVVIKSNASTAAIGGSGISLTFSNGAYVKDDVWTLEILGVSVDADLIIDAV